MKPTISRDGVIRVELTVKARLSLQDMVNLYLRKFAPVAANLNSLLRELNKKTVKAIKEDIQDQIRCDGSLHAGYWVADNLDEEWFLDVEKVFKKRFPRMLPTEAQKKAIEKFGLKAAP